MVDAIPKPSDVFDRSREWKDLVGFITDPTPGFTVALVYGRRRQGKSFLLRRLAQGAGGFYHQALEIEPAQALEDLGEKLGAHLGVGRLALDDWSSAIGTLASLSTMSSALGAAPLGGATHFRPAVAILDEFPYFVAKEPALPSIVQRVVDDWQAGAAAPVRLILCGSALSVMEDLLEGPLRGRIRVHVLVKPFDHAEFAAYWEIDDPALAFRVHAIVGGTPGYRGLVRRVPESMDDFDRWILEEILAPSSPLFNEDEFLLGEERSLSDRSLYHSVLAAIADGATSETRIAASVGRAQRGIQHALRELVRTGFVVKRDDLLRTRRPIYRIADPIVRFHHVVTKPDVSRFEDRRGEAAWADAGERFEAQVLGPHFEHLVREYVAHQAPTEITGGPIGDVGSVVIFDARERDQHEIDVVALEPMSNSKRRGVRLLGEAKVGELGAGELRRLERIRDLVKAPAARLLLASVTGFSANLVDMAEGRTDVVLVSVGDIFGSA